MFSVSTKGIRDSVSGIVYVLELDIEDKKLIKIGMTSRKKVEERVCEILTSCWVKYRIFPRCYVKRYKKHDDPFAIEATLHRVLASYKYKTKYVFSGSTEIFEVPLYIVTGLYDLAAKGVSEDDLCTRLQEYERVSDIPS